MTVTLLLTFKPFVYFELLFVYGRRKWSNFIPLHMGSQLPSTVENSIFSHFNADYCLKSVYHRWVGLFLKTPFNFHFLYVYLYASLLEKAMAPHSSTLAWKIPWMEEPGRLQSMGLLGVGHD